jgi:hypothetical protein
MSYLSTTNTRYDGMHPYVREHEWLQFLQWGKRHPEFKFDTGADYLKGLIEWAVKHHRGTAEDIAAKALRGMIDRSGQ